MTLRTNRLKENVLFSEPTISSERARIFTESVKENERDPTGIRLAKAFADVLDQMTIRIEDGEMIVGNMGPTPRSCQVFPEYSWTWIADELDRLEHRRTERFVISDDDKRTLRRVFEYWKGKSTAEIAMGKIPEQSKKASKAGLFTIGAPGTGIGHVIVDYQRVIRVGIKGLLAEIAQRKPDADENARILYEAMEIQLDAVIRFAHRFSTLASDMASIEEEPVRQAELKEISRICRVVPENPAKTFHEALQSFWFIHLLTQIESNGHSMSTGRFDQYLYPFLEQDLEEGRLSEDDAIELLEMLWIKFSSLIKLRNEYYSIAFAGHPMFQNLTLGGQDKNGNDACNLLTKLALQATSNIQVTQPTVSFRWHEKTPRSMKEQVIDLVSKGLGMPGIFNDEVIIPMMKEKGTDPRECYNYSILGCVEPIIEGKSDPRPNIGYVNLPKILEITLNNGIDPKTGEQVGLQTGNPTEFSSFEDLWNAYQEQIDYAIEMLTEADRVAARVLAEYKPTPFISSLLQGCIENGKSMQDGGAVYNSGGIMGVGLAIAADSLENIRFFVFDRKEVSMKDLLDALSRDFDGYEILRQKLLKHPRKYGNDIEDVDFLARDTGRTFCNAIQKRMTTRNGSYHGALFSVSMYIPQGEVLGATPDGRRAGLMVSDGVSPAQNRDLNGPTAAMKSVARLDHGLCYNGTLYNMKFTPDLFASPANREKFSQLIDAYFKLGGLHIQFNVVSREVLEDAKTHPENHRNLIVRVAGYSAFFVELDPFVQDEIIARTEFTAGHL